jgi:hypothetical protein
MSALVACVSCGTAQPPAAGRCGVCSAPLAAREPARPDGSVPSTTVRMMRTRRTGVGASDKTATRRGAATFGLVRDAADLIDHLAAGVETAERWGRRIAAATAVVVFSVWFATMASARPQSSVLVAALLALVLGTGATWQLPPRVAGRAAAVLRTIARSTRETPEKAILFADAVTAELGHEGRRRFHRFVPVRNIRTVVSFARGLGITDLRAVMTAPTRLAWLTVASIGLTFLTFAACALLVMH